MSEDHGPPTRERSKWLGPAIVVVIVLIILRMGDAADNMSGFDLILFPALVVLCIAGLIDQLRTGWRPSGFMSVLLISLAGLVAVLFLASLVT